ncbi:methyltransferase family protein [Paraburkholderia sp. BL6665CI2N2]|uniref:methyltransferase domain-containing protein n=1 Tax=Paraburkholderia sp. BL6665CI2N2 TaxID=1938806 RepID=UPI001064BED5|nr:methyltransferase domain-containing protein [Paraburkholderia sp. BL6665CI2N2]TDY25465.1 methyltransferase family protein [Paraburkholderia sp. BL6665CI2N2]
MGRHESITRHITKEEHGIEIGAWYNGIAPKRLGYNCLTLDVFDAPTLRARAEQDPTISREIARNIEDVDMVGSSTSIAQLVAARGETGKFDYIVSSHNLEHSPDPITFLQGCEQVLKPGGYLSMIVPDRRGCFDYFRPSSTTAEMLAAFFEKRSRPTNAQIFEHCSLHARRLEKSGQQVVFPFALDPREIIPFEHLRIEFELWQKRVRSGDESYRDAHCWTFTPAAFELILQDLSFLKLTKFEVVEIEPAEGEFFVHLRNGENFLAEEENFYKRRTQLLLRMNDEASITAPRVRDLQSELDSTKSELISMRSELVFTQSEVASARERIVSLEAELAGYRQREADLLKAKLLTHEAIEAITFRAKRAESDLRAMRESTSWRLTALLRVVSSAVRKGAR